MISLYDKNDKHKSVVVCMGIRVDSGGLIGAGVLEVREFLAEELRFVCGGVCDFRCFGVGGSSLVRWFTADSGARGYRRWNAPDAILSYPRRPLGHLKTRSYSKR